MMKTPTSDLQAGGSAPLYPDSDSELIEWLFEILQSYRHVEAFTLKV